ncbi:MAG: hypothetical protein MAGBODY4_01064 [Candidatus Marinimicrobia bacterium]|nr:hypothetical protein [Candidatus Neomarinimicrobiota bacterium]
MWPYFSTDYSGNRFGLFSTSHWTALAILLVLYLTLFRFRRYFRGNGSADKTARFIIAFILILQEIVLNIWRFVNGDWSIATSLPLHLCGIAVMLSAIMMYNKNYLLYEITFFWGLGGALQALITPDIGPYGFPHFRYFHFFVSHGTIILASLYMTFVHRYRPHHKSVWKIFVLTNAYAAFIGFFNWITGANYLYICHKPETSSMLDVMGPWPWYLISLEVLALASFYLYYSPFALRRKLLTERTE